MTPDAPLMPTQQAAPGSTTPPVFPLHPDSSRTTISLARSQESRPRLTLSVRLSGACNPSIARAR
eukprot:scaffold76862_cov98-Phaeocystis_antarctica.AAC.2